jgi:hypothetical protein
VQQEAEHAGAFAKTFYQFSTKIPEPVFFFVPAREEIFLELARDIFISLKIARTPLPSFPRAILSKLKVCDFVHGAASLRIARAGYSQRMLMTRASLRFLSWLMVLCYRLL